jgi:hypothetical protein
MVYSPLTSSELVLAILVMKGARLVMSMSISVYGQLANSRSLRLPMHSPVGPAEQSDYSSLFSSCLY